MVICLEQGADWHMAQLLPLPLTVSCFSKIQIGFAFLVPAHLRCHRSSSLHDPGSPGKGAIKWVYVHAPVSIHILTTVRGIHKSSGPQCQSPNSLKTTNDTVNNISQQMPTLSVVRFSLCSHQNLNSLYFLAALPDASCCCCFFRFCASTNRYKVLLNLLYNITGL